MMHAVFAIIPAILAALPLFGTRFIPTHDGEYHIIRFWQFFQGLTEGVAFPRWAGDLYQGFGIPLFTFQYPFPNYVGSLFHAFGLSFVDSVKWTLAAGYLAAALFCYLFLSKRHGGVAAIAGVIAGSFVPYWFVDIYVRGSVGEVWAIACVFLSLAAISRGNALLLSAAVALLIVSHNILAMLFVPVIAAYTIVCRRQYFWFALLGIGGAAVFWLPALYEQRFIGGLSPVNVFEHFPSLHQLLIPSWGTGFRGSVGGDTEMSYQIGIVPMLALLISPLLVFRKKGRHDSVFFILLFLIAVLGMLPVSAVLWKAVPFLHFVQYPWRLLSFVTVATPVMVSEIAARSKLGWVLPFLAVLLAFSYARPVLYEPRADTHYLNRESFTKGTSSLGNTFRTLWPVRPDTARSVVFSNGMVETVRSDRTKYEFKTESTVSGTLFVPVAYYPGWVARVDGRRASVSPSTSGTVSVPITAGTHEVSVAYAQTNDQVLSVIISIISLSAALVSYILMGR